MLFQRIYRPRPGDIQKVFIAARLNTAGQNVYRGDAVVYDTGDPTAQTTDGILDGRTIGANDFFWVKPINTVVGTFTDAGLQAGVIEGTHVGDRDTVTALVDNSVVIVQVFGVFATHCNVDSAATVAGDKLFINAGAYSQLRRVQASLGGTATTAATAVGEANCFVGVALTADASYTRGAGSANGVTALIKCL